MMYPQGSTVVNATSGNVTAAVATATLPADANQFNFLAGFDITGCGATAGSVVDVTVTGVAGGTLTYKLVVPAGATVSHGFQQKFFDPPLKSSAKNTAIVVSCPSLGAGNLHNAVHAFGFKYPE